jgi:hypothetical protein
MRNKLLILLYSLAAAYALWRGVRIAFFPIAMSATQPAAGGAELIQPAFSPVGLPILIVVVLVYAVLGYSLSIGAIAVFRTISAVHIVLSLLSLPSYGSLFLPSSLLLLTATLISIGSKPDLQRWKNAV